MRYFILVVILVGQALIFTNKASAAPNILTYDSTQTLDFGSVTKQTGVDITSTVSNTGSGHGEIKIKDSTTSPDTINITFQSCGLTSDKVRVKDFTAKYGSQSWTITGDGPFTQSGLQNPSNGGTKLQYGASILVTKDAKTGSLSPCFNVSIQYDCASDHRPCTTAAPVVDNERANVLVLGAPIILNEIQQIDFGAITRPTANSTVIIKPDGAMNVASGDAILLNSSSGYAGRFEIIAEKNVPISISATRGGENQGLRLNNFTATFNGSSVQNINNSSNAKTFTSTLTGTNNLLIGATLEMTASNVKAGKYNITYDVNIDYQ